jgi:ferredoxin
MSDEPASFTVTFTRIGRSIPCDRTTTVLAAARAAGIRLPFSCAKGVCGTCKSKLISGQVDMKHGGGIRPKEIAEGWALLCCSRPLEDLVVDR